MGDWGQAGSGAVGGALGGAAIGSAFGPIGTGIGAGLGAIGGGIKGWFSGGESKEQVENRRRLEEYYKMVQGREAPQMGPAAQGSYSNFRGNQSALISRLEGMANGTGPSLAAQQLQSATDRNMSQQAGVAASGRGGPLAAQQAANNMALLGAKSAQDSAGARIGEQQMALNQLGLTIHGARGADEDMNRFNAGQTNEASQANLMARLKTMGMNDQAIAGVLGQMSGNANAQAAKPGEGDALLAGGAGAFAQYAGMGGMGKSRTPYTDAYNQRAPIGVQPGQAGYGSSGAGRFDAANYMSGLFRG